MSRFIYTGDTKLHCLKLCIVNSSVLGHYVKVSHKPRGPPVCIINNYAVVNSFLLLMLRMSKGSLF